MKRNGKIEFFRIFFCLLVVLTHSKVFLEHSRFGKGALAVDFFFLVSGYLMANSVFKKKDLPLDHLGAETCTFIVRKIKALMPNFLIAYCLASVVYFNGIGHMDSKKEMVKRMVETIWELLQLTMAGFGEHRVNGADWYISAMLLAMFILYPFVRSRYELFIHVIGPVTAIFLYGYMFRDSGTSMGVFKDMFFATKGFFRAIAGISLGTSLYPMARYLSSQKLTEFSRWMITLLESFCYGCIFYHCLTASKNTFDFQIIILIAIAVVCSFSHQGKFADLFDNKVSYFLGAFSLNVYLSHLYWGRWINYRLSDMSDKRQFVLYFALTFGTAIILHIISKFIRSFMSRHDFKHFFIEE